LTQPSISKSEDKEEIEIDITDDDHAWVERIGKTAYEICNDPARDRIKLNEQLPVLLSNLMTLLYWVVLDGL